MIINSIGASIKSKLLSLILALSFLTSFSNAQENKLTAAVPDWTGGEITCQLAVTILEEELGYKVKRVVFPSGTALWQAIADGEIDFYYRVSAEYSSSGSYFYDCN